MPKPKKKLLPKDFEALLKVGDIEALKAAFLACEINARGGYSKQPALAYNDCPDELARWLIANGADIEARDNYGETSLHYRARHWQGRIAVLLNLGADVNAEDSRGNTPLHGAANVHHMDNAKLLIANGASVDALNNEGQSPLIYALYRCTNTQVKTIAAMAELLLDHSEPEPPPQQPFWGRLFGKPPQDPQNDGVIEKLVKRIGTQFEWHRSNFNREHVDEASAGLDRLYALFGVTPIPRRVFHDGKAKIAVTTTTLIEQHEQLWQLLVPSSGAAKTVQGEVIRISGRISDEMDRNGGANWDDQYRMMADAFLVHVRSGAPLPDSDLAEAESLVRQIKARRGDPDKLCEMAVAWVQLNSEPAQLAKPEYSR